MVADHTTLLTNIKTWGAELGFQQVGVTDTHLEEAETRLQDWLAQKFHGEMHYMAEHGTKRTRPAELVPGTIRIISVRMNYLPPEPRIRETLRDKARGYIARYALGRDYHKLMRKRLKRLAERIQEEIGPFGYRCFADSAPVMEKPIAQKAGLGWMGKNTLILNREAGSYFFLGTIYTDLPLPVDQPFEANHCGTCTACLDICPTDAFVKPYVLDARKCISYLTIEYKGSIPVELRSKMGNRIFGCDDCQLVCPWNKFAKVTQETAFLPRHELDHRKLIELFNWSEETFVEKTLGSPLKRATYEGWLRNIAVALGNAPKSEEVVAALTSRLDHPSAIVREHVEWALQRHN